MARIDSALSTKVLGLAVPCLVRLRAENLLFSTVGE